MLVLSRREQQAICIGSEILVTVLEIRAGSVRLGVVTPPEMPVHRLEVRCRIDEAVRAAEVQVGKVGSPESIVDHSLPSLDPPRHP
jgi:carbon storage regulator